MEKLKIVWSVKSECGPIRKKNEDSVFPDLSGSGFVPFKAGVFDGMGGHKKGEVASELASSVMQKDYENLISYVEEANKAIYEYQENNKDSEGMGTTMTAIRIDESGVLHVAHVGDSRCYVLSKRNPNSPSACARSRPSTASDTTFIFVSRILSLVYYVRNFHTEICETFASQYVHNFSVANS